MKHPICFTVDVEDGISLSMRDNFNRPMDQTNRVVTSTNQILDLLDKHQVKGTFFTLGQVGEKFPALIKDVVNRGHEMAVHGYDHWTFDRMTPEKALDEISRAKKLFEDLTGVEVTGHRAPAFSISKKTAWGLEVVAKAGFKYDSSILPANMGAFSWPGFSKDICNIALESGQSIIEIPISTVNLRNKEIPFSGGGYFRVMPQWLIQRLFDKYTDKQTAIHYMHPYEIDTERYPDYYFEELKKAPLTRSLKMRSYWLKRKYIPRKLSMLFSNFDFIRMDEYVNRAASTCERFKLEELIARKTPK